MPGPIPPALLWAFGGLTGLGFTAMLVMRRLNYRDRLRERIKTATLAHLRVRRMAAPRLLRAGATQKQNTPMERAAALFGFDSTRPEQYPAKWWVVLAATLIVVRIEVGLLVALGGSVSWVAAPVSWVMLSRFVFKSMIRRRRARLYGQFPDCLAMIVRSVRAGVPLTESIRIVAREIPSPSADEFAVVAGDLAIGMPLADALNSLAERAEITEFRFFSTALALQAQTGGRLGETLDNLASIVRKRMALKSRGRALASEARTTAYILGGLPVLAAGALYLLNPSYVSMLFTDPSGRMILMAAVLSLSIGAFIMKTIIEKALA